MTLYSNPNSDVQWSDFRTLCLTLFFGGPSVARRPSFYIVFYSVRKIRLARSLVKHEWCSTLTFLKSPKTRCFLRRKSISADRCDTWHFRFFEKHDRHDTFDTSVFENFDFNRQVRHLRKSHFTKHRVLRVETKVDVRHTSYFTTRISTCKKHRVFGNLLWF